MWKRSTEGSDGALPYQRQNKPVSSFRQVARERLGQQHPAKTGCRGLGEERVRQGERSQPRGSWQSWRPARPRSTKFKTLNIRTTRERLLQPGKTHENHRGTLLSYELTVSHHPLHL